MADGCLSDERKPQGVRSTSGLLMNSLLILEKWLSISGFAHVGIQSAYPQLLYTLHASWKTQAEICKVTGLTEDKDKDKHPEIVKQSSTRDFLETDHIFKEKGEKTISSRDVNQEAFWQPTVPFVVPKPRLDREKDQMSDQGINLNETKPKLTESNQRVILDMKINTSENRWMSQAPSISISATKGLERRLHLYPADLLIRGLPNNKRAVILLRPFKRGGQKEGGLRTHGPSRNLRRYFALFLGALSLLVY
ncbi:hypothetical protein ACMD2_23600 [Ananas comosus]|uniref:Uncharacterized protein n=1 Tax=Ananas comosus TaxID=4615 RepID=A0A199UHQ5_ANACO|nr:hypothetical protein ACMD2_23600 [Ananas comosus]